MNIISSFIGNVLSFTPAIVLSALVLNPGSAAADAVNPSNPTSPSVVQLDDASRVEIVPMEAVSTNASDLIIAAPDRPTGMSFGIYPMSAAPMLDTAPLAKSLTPDGSTPESDPESDKVPPAPTQNLGGEQTDTEPTTQPSPALVPGDEPPSDALEQVVQDVENPIVDRVSIPIANRTAFGIGPFQQTANVTNIQLVLPIPLGENYVVLRPSVPFVYVPTIQPPPVPNQGPPASTPPPPAPTQPPQGGTFGLGDIRMQAYFVPHPGRRLTWGIGPTFLFPTASDRRLGFGKWGIGPTFVAVWSEGRWTLGGRIENYWSVAGDETRPDVSQLTINPLATYVLGHGWYLVSAPVITAFWNLPGEKWLVPIGGGIGKVMTLGGLPFNVSIQAYWHAVRPTNSEGWALVVQFQSLFPR
jgi:hypothetical protein